MTEPPALPHADPDKAPRRRTELAQEILRFHRGKALIERDDEDVRDSELADELQLVAGRSQQACRILGPEDLRGMRVKRQRHRRAALSPCGIQSGPEHRLVAEMHAVENAGRHNQRPAKRCQAVHVGEDVHPRNCMLATVVAVTRRAAWKRREGS